MQQSNGGGVGKSLTGRLTSGVGNGGVESVGSGIQGQTRQQQQQQQNRTKKLQVYGALNYLDQVRKQFADNVQVYNAFLEVMKEFKSQLKVMREFKSQSIDMQGVIRRVSQLFAAHPDLITGFNTFLPPGYEVRVSGSFTTIIEPSGSVSRLINNGTEELVEMVPVPDDALLPAGNIIPTVQHFHLNSHQKQAATLGGIMAVDFVPTPEQQMITKSGSVVQGGYHHIGGMDTMSQQTSSSTHIPLQPQIYLSTSHATATTVSKSVHQSSSGPKQPQPPQGYVIYEQQSTQLDSSATTYNISMQQPTKSQTSQAKGHTKQTSSQHKHQTVNVAMSTPVSGRQTPSTAGAFATFSTISSQQQKQHRFQPAVCAEFPPEIRLTQHKSGTKDFNQALNYLSMIKERFEDRIEIYENFLKILNNYQLGTREDGTQGIVTEAEVSAQVSRLFHNEPDLMEGFKSFLPDVQHSPKAITDAAIGDNGTSFVIKREYYQPTPSPPSAAEKPTTATKAKKPSKTHQISCIEPKLETEQVDLNEDNEYDSTYDEKPPILMSNSAENTFVVPVLPTQVHVLEHSVTGLDLDARNKISSAGASNIQPHGSIGKPTKMKPSANGLPDADETDGTIVTTTTVEDQKPSTSTIVMMPSGKSRVVQVAASGITTGVYATTTTNKKSLQQQFSVPSMSSLKQRVTEKTGAKKRSAPAVFTASNMTTHHQMGNINRAEATNSGAIRPPSSKKSKVISTVAFDKPVSELLKDIPLKEFEFFEEINKSLNSEAIFKNFLRCLLLFTKEIISKNELIQLVSPFFVGFPELLNQLKQMVIFGRKPNVVERNKLKRIEDRLPMEIASQIDYATCKRLGVSYRSLPQTVQPLRCSGRTELCKSVLNDCWVSFPSWSSEDTSSVSSKKTQFEDFMYRTEDERFEVDILIEVNNAAITALEYVKRNMDECIKSNQLHKFVINKNFGCSSPTLMQRAVKKLYGEHTSKVMESLRENPLVAVPQVLKRLREKDKEWREIREEFNLIWRDQIEKNYLKSLDHQATTFKANDVKLIRSKQLIQQLENLYNERHTRVLETGKPESGPNMILLYPEEREVFADASDLLIHHVKRQASLSKREKISIKRLLRSVVPRLFNLEVESISDDDDEQQMPMQQYNVNKDDEVLERLTSKYLKKGAIDSTKSDASEDGRNETKLEEMQRRARECSEGTKGEGKQKSESEDADRGLTREYERKQIRSIMAKKAMEKQKFEEQQQPSSSFHEQSEHIAIKERKMRARTDDAVGGGSNTFFSDTPSYYQASTSSENSEHCNKHSEKRDSHGMTGKKRKREISIDQEEAPNRLKIINNDRIKDLAMANISIVDNDHINPKPCTSSSYDNDLLEARNKRRKTVDKNGKSRKSRKEMVSAEKENEIFERERRINENQRYTVFMGTNAFVLFIRLHLLLVERLAIFYRQTEELVEEYRFEECIKQHQAEIFAEHGRSDESLLMNAIDTSIGLRDLKKPGPTPNPAGFYSSLIQEIKNLLDGLVESSTFEESLRAMFSTRAYVMFTVDKLVAALTRQMQNFICDELSVAGLTLFNKYRPEGMEQKPELDRIEYMEAAEKLMVDQNCFKMFFLHLQCPRVTVELIDTDEHTLENEQNVQQLRHREEKETSNFDSANNEKRKSPQMNNEELDQKLEKGDDENTVKEATETRKLPYVASKSLNDVTMEELPKK